MTRASGQPTEAAGHDLIGLPRWLSDISQSLCIRMHFLISGNTHDIYAVNSAEGSVFLPQTDALWHVLSAAGLDGLLIFDPVEGVRPHHACPALPETWTARRAAGPREAPSPADDLVQLFGALNAETELRLGLVIDYASRFLDGLGGTRQDLDQFLIAIDKLSRSVPADADGRTLSPVFWVLERPGDLPAWFAVHNPLVRSIEIDLPDQEERLAFSKHLVQGRAGHRDDPHITEAVEQLALQSEGMKLSTMRQVALLAEAQDMPLDAVSDAVRAFRLGTPRNPWRSQLMRSRIAAGEEILTRRVKGQSRAVTKTLDILMRSFMGLSGAQSSSRHTRPRGVLFFAGPTGVGKTELSKAVTELLFGDETAYHRFDMSEFLTEKSETRLIGAPPGSTGHEAGGELVNAVRNRPFGVFLFDEIEKAHPRVLDLFLQIIDEGRLTDARGETAYFSEALLIFTSNIGIVGTDTATNRGLRVLPGDSHESLEAKIVKGIQDHFRFQLQRPELMNRLGQNIVVFDFINVASAAAIFDAILQRVLQAVYVEHRIEVGLVEDVRAELEELCTHDLFEGGRGIGNRLETNFINPLSRLLFERPGVAEIIVTGINRDEDGVVLETR